MKIIEELSKKAWNTRGAQYFRILAGVTVVYQILILYAQRDLIYGPSAIYPFEVFAAGFGKVHYSPLALSPSPLFFQLFFHASAVVALLWTLGIGTRVLTPVVWFAVHSLHARCPGLWDGGDNAMALLLIYASFMDLRPLTPGLNQPGRLSNLFHNFGLIACTAQMTIIYTVAGITKLAGKYWTNGTAFYYVLRSGEFGVTGVGPWLWNRPVLLAALTWAPVLMQIAFPWVCFFGRATPRRILIMAAVGFHAGIFFLMGLETFALFMISGELMLLSDPDYERVDRLREGISALVRRGRSALGRIRASREVAGLTASAIGDSPSPEAR